MSAVLEIEDLRISFRTDRGIAEVVNGVSITIEEGKVHGLVGESGSGKSVTSRSVLGILPTGAIASKTGAIRYKGRNLIDLDEATMRDEIRGTEIAMVFQDPMTALNPVMRIGQQLVIPIRRHKKVKKAAAQALALDLLAQVGLPDPMRAAHSYPHELSGGQRQRVMIAIALSCDPKLLIADEPTTALDVTVQAQILDLFDRLRTERGLSVLLVTHDLSLVAERCDSVSVMYAGKVVEHGTAVGVFDEPRHPYTELLEAARPRLDDPPHTLLKTIPGRVPDLHHLPPGCSFAARCPRVLDECRFGQIDRAVGEDGHSFACVNPLPIHLGIPLVPTLTTTETGSDR